MYQVAIVGVGHWGPNIAKSFELTGRAKVRWLCDLSESRLKAVATKYPEAKTTGDYGALLSDSELRAIAISTPVPTHFDLARDALEAGKDVLLEKPLTADSRQAIELTRLAQKRGRVLMVGHVFEYNATIRALQEIVASGELGDIHYFSCERTNLGPVRTDINALWDLATHDVSIIRDVLGCDPCNVTARGAAFLNDGVEDVVLATYGFPAGTIAHVHSSWLNPRKVRQITVVGSRKMAIWDDLDLKTPIRIFDKRVEAAAPPSGVSDTYMKHKTAPVDGGVFIPNVELNQPLKAECEHFLDCLDSGATPRSDGRVGTRVVRAIEAAQESLRGGSKVIEIGYDDCP